MKKKILITIGLIIVFGLGFMGGQVLFVKDQKPSEIVQQVVDRSLDKYTIDNLSKAEIKPQNIALSKLIKDYPDFTSNEFVMDFNPDLQSKNVKKVSGMLNIPKEAGKYPLIVMIRGYVPSDQFFTGNGTYNSSLFFAKNGFITISPDFLGYGDSDKEAGDVFEARFQTYTTVMSLIASINTSSVLTDKWDGNNIFIWGHSNGGQIALTTLEVTSKEYPTVLWAPVSISFPYSILYYTDESDDHGKALRRELARFENVYDTENYSLSNYLVKIKASIQVNQGTSDDAVPVKWTDNLYNTLKGQGIKINYNLYPGSNHNMEPTWNTAINKDLEFFKENLKR